MTVQTTLSTPPTAPARALPGAGGVVTDISSVAVMAPPIEHVGDPTSAITASHLKEQMTSLASMLNAETGWSSAESASEKAGVWAAMSAGSPATAEAAGSPSSMADTGVSGLGCARGAVSNAAAAMRSKSATAAGMPPGRMMAPGLSDAARLACRCTCGDEAEHEHSNFYDQAQTASARSDVRCMCAPFALDWLQLP